MTPKVLLAGVVVIVSGAGLIQFMGPETTNPATDPARTLQARVSVPADTDAILQRACRDCHSHDTRWPWYSHVAPVSWFVIDHVNHGRRHFNYSDWATYDADDTARLLKNTCELARKGAMPLPSYLRLHDDAVLSAADVDTLCRWSASVAAGQGMKP
jgi:heme-binding protein